MKKVAGNGAPLLTRTDAPVKKSEKGWTYRCIRASLGMCLMGAAAGSTWQWLQTKFQQLKIWHIGVLTAIAEVPR